MNTPLSAADSQMFCRACGYPLVGLPSRRCPECGRDFDPHNPKSFLAHPPRVLLRRIVKLMLVLFCLTLPADAYFGYLDWQLHREKMAIQFLRANGAIVHTYDTRPHWMKVVFQGHAAWLWERVDWVDSGQMTQTTYWPNMRQSLAAMTNFKSLRKLDLGGLGNGVADNDLTQLKGLVALQELDLSHNTEVTDAGLVNLKGLIALQHLDLFGTKITDAGLTQLKGLIALQTLSLGGTQVTGDGLLNLKELRSLKSLNLANAPVTDKGLVNLKDLTALRALGLGFTSVTDAGLMHLKGLTSLQSLSLEHTRVTDNGLVNLNGLTALQRLSLDSTPVTNAGLAHLTGLRALNWLSLDDTSVTNAGLVNLNGLKALQWLNLSHTPVTFDGIEILHEVSYQSCNVRS